MPSASRPASSAQGTTSAGLSGRAAMIQKSPGRNVVPVMVTVIPVPLSCTGVLGVNVDLGRGREVGTAIPDPQVEEAV